MSNLSTLPKGDSAWLLRKAIERIIQQVSVLETNIGSSTTGNSANTQVIFNDNGTLRGDAGLTYNKTTDLLTVGAATITGDLTVDTSTLKVDSANDRVGIGTATPAAGATLSTVGTTSVSASNYTSASTWSARFQAAANNQPSGIFLSGLTSGGLVVPGSLHVEPVAASSRSALIATYAADSAVGYFAINRFSPSAGTTTQHFKIADDGVATWSNVGGVAGTAMTLNSTGLGVGGSPASKLYAYGSNVSGIGQFRIDCPAAGTAQQTFAINGTYQGQLFTDGTKFVIGTPNSTPIVFRTNLTEALTIDASQNVGVGVTPSAWGSNFRGVDIGSYTSLAQSSSGYSRLANNAYNNNTNWIYRNTAAATLYEAGGGTHSWQIAPSGTAGNAITFTQAMTLDASGNLLVGTTSQIRGGQLSVDSSAGVASGLKTSAGSSVYVQELWNTGSLDNSFINFGTDSTFTARGSITYNRSGGLVAYNTTSDYRAKDIIGPVSNSGSVIDSLKVYIGKMKGASVERPMLVAHEAQSVAPYSVTGQKDEVDADGNPKYQQMDVSSFVPLLIAEIQSLRTRVAALEA